MFSVVRNITLGMILGLGLVACGDDDKAIPAANDSVAAPAAAAPTTAPAPLMEIEKAEGVIYQDEIYANWPYN
tara:strand:+ start:220 stop:438 length:219 start_codon:yes stop_codon:yes gene_type:complete